VCGGLESMVDDGGGLEPVARGEDGAESVIVDEET
jgi:hypothetical protein